MYEFKCFIQKKIQISNPWHLLATGLGSGLYSRMPGTIGSIVAMLIWHELILFVFQSRSSLLVFILFTILVGIDACDKTERDTQSLDPGFIVLDEFIGMWITFFFFQQIIGMRF
nr:phosphatidylglycerophosphatase A [Candidatus Schneideria nysicola]